VQSLFAVTFPAVYHCEVGMCCVLCVYHLLCTHRDEKAKWIRAKYEDKEFLPPPPYVDVAMPQVTTACFHVMSGGRQFAVIYSW